MEGEVNEKESWIFYPVNKSFVNDFEDKIKYIKCTNDFRLFLPEDKTDGADFFNTYKTKMYSQTYRYTKMGDTDIKSKPYFVRSCAIKISSFAPFSTSFFASATIFSIVLDLYLPLIDGIKQYVQ